MRDKTKYWLELCDEDLTTAKFLHGSSRWLHMGFFCHLVAEKALKAVASETSDKVPPRTHDLHRLASLSGVFDELNDEYLDLLDKLNPLQIETRYPEYKSKIATSMNKKYCTELLKETEEFLCWIRQKLET